MTPRIVFLDTECARDSCTATFRPTRPTHRYCTKSCAMQVVASARRGEANSNWRGGKTAHPLYDVYLDMVSRCTRPTHPRYGDYGGRGITVCKRWREDFWAYATDVGERPGPGYSLDRRDNDGPYDPGNVRWATASEQSRNRRTSGWESRVRNTRGQFV